MDKVLSDRLIFWMVIILTMVFISNIIYFKTSSKSVYKEDVDKVNLETLLDYFPTRTMKKIFKNESKNETFTHLVDFVKDGMVQIKQIDRLSKVVMVYRLDDESIRLVYTKELKDDRVGMDYTKDIIPNRNDIILMSPIEVGISWTDDDGGRYEIIKKDAIIKTPAGSFQTLLVKYTNEEFTVKEYYAKDIGLVKIVVNNFDAFDLVNIQ